ncbi:MAG: 30S ribosome-binding factor RbfA [Anaerolineales bacterium]|jgi:ribosome-binding factor A
MASEARAKRVADRIHEELAEIVLREISDPRLTGLTVTSVEVDRELAYATIYVTSFLADSVQDEVLAGLESAKSFIRRLLARQIQVKSFPQLRFRWDDSQIKAERIDELLNKIHEEHKEGGKDTREP